MVATRGSGHSAFMVRSDSRTPFANQKEIQKYGNANICLKTGNDFLQCIPVDWSLVILSLGSYIRW